MAAAFLQLYLYPVGITYLQHLFVHKHDSTPSGSYIIMNDIL